MTKKMDIQAWKNVIDASSGCLQFQQKPDTYIQNGEKINIAANWMKFDQLPCRIVHRLLFFLQRIHTLISQNLYHGCWVNVNVYIHINLAIETTKTLDAKELFALRTSQTIFGFFSAPLIYLFWILKIYIVDWWWVLPVYFFLSLLLKVYWIMSH